MTTIPRFKPRRWMANNHLQTCLPTVISRLKRPLPVKIEPIALPDGDVIELCSYGDKTHPPLLLMPGLEGDYTSPYIRSVGKYLQKKGWYIIVMHYRSCGTTKNFQPRSYNAHCCEDFNFFLDYIAEYYDLKPKYAIGFSMGGNLLLHHAWQQSHQPFEGIITVSTPFDMLETVNHLPTFYEKNFLIKFKTKTIKRLKQGADLPVTVEQIKNVASLKEFDNLLTAPLWDHADAEAYYRYSTCSHFLDKITTPTHMLFALDDPFIPEHSVPNQLNYEYVTIEAIPTGGHVGFVAEEKVDGTRYWLGPKLQHHLLDLQQQAA